MAHHFDTDRRLGQIDSATISAAVPEIGAPVPGASLLQFYALAVAAGVTVYFITRVLDRGHRR